MQHSPAPRVQTAYNESVRPRKEHEMSIPKLCLRLAVFLCTLTIALFVTRLFLIPPRVEVKVAAPAPTVNDTTSPSLVVVAPQVVMVTNRNGKVYARLTVERMPDQPARPMPEHLWVWAY